MKRRKKTKFRKRNPPPGSGPGALAINGQSPRPVVRVTEYGPDHATEHGVCDPNMIRNYLRGDHKLWVDVQGLGDERTLTLLAEVFGLHPLALADVVNVPQRPKVEPYESHTFVVVRMVRLEAPGRVNTEQVSMFIGRNYLITFQERYGDVLDPVRERLRQGAGTIRTAGPDYLAYCVWDAIVDGYFPILEDFGEYLEKLEEQTVVGPGPALLREIHETKHELLEMRRALWPQREALNLLIRDPNAHVSDGVKVYLRDCYDHCVQIVEVLETYREVAWGLMDVYMSSLSNRQNEIMKVLTLVATIFIPLTFLVGVYGMNFDYLPELHWRWAYPVLWLIMLAAAGAMAVYFRRKGWLGGQPRQDNLRIPNGEHEEKKPRQNGQ